MSGLLQEGLRRNSETAARRHQSRNDRANGHEAIVLGHGLDERTAGNEPGHSHTEAVGTMCRRHLAISDVARGGQAAGKATRSTMFRQERPPHRRDMFTRPCTVVSFCDDDIALNCATAMERVYISTPNETATQTKGRRRVSRRSMRQHVGAEEETAAVDHVPHEHQLGVSREARENETRGGTAASRC